MEWTTACPDWERRIVAREPLIAMPPLFASEAQAGLEVFNALRMVDAPGSPLLGEVCRDWIKDFVASVFGAYDPETGRRMITEWFELVGKKNGKSSIAAGIMLTALLRNWRKSAEFLILAPTVEIANNSFYPARDMVRADADLSAILHVQDYYRTITHRTTGASLKVIAAENEAVSGKKATGILVDEVWLFGKRPNAENMFREATGGLASRPEGFVIWLSTEADTPPEGVFKQKLDYARGVRDGRIQDRRFVPILFEFPRAMLEADEHLQSDNFYIPNPNLGVSVDLEFLVREQQKAEEAGEESMRGFLAKHLNVEIGLALQGNNWTGATFWIGQGDADLSLDRIIERSDVVTFGIDGGGLDDLLGASAIGRDTKSGDWLHWAKAWMHPIALERRKKNTEIYRDFERDGDLVIVRELGEDLEQLAGYIMQIEASGLLDRIGVDAVGIGQVLDAIERAGIEHERIVAIPQGWKLAGAIKTTERRLAEGTMRHGARPLMTWCVGNAKVEARGNAVIITKQAAGFAKIDPLIATFNAAALMSMNPQARRSGLQFAIV